MRQREGGRGKGGQGLKGTEIETGRWVWGMRGRCYTVHIYLDGMRGVYDMI